MAPKHKNIFIAVLVLLFSMVTTTSQSQAKKPKIALVLSGGGAKGVAHIPLLQTLDSLNIVPDIVVGTSMGSIVGGLYSIGYSGDSIAKLVHKTKWENLLTSATAFDKVSSEEKSEYNKYLVGFRFEKGKLKSTSYLLNDQNLRNTLKILTLPAYNIRNFDSLQIQFRAVTADILTSKPKILAKGDLCTAMRASMSIPGIFEPVLMDESWLVDGGVINNFPTDIAKLMGADIIIGSDVTEQITSIENLNNLNAVIKQTMMLSNNKLHPLNVELCDIYIHHSPNLSYSTADFDKCEILYNEGKIATRQNLKSLIELSKKLEKFTQKKIKLTTFENKIVFDTIIYKDISKSNLNLIKDRINIIPHKEYTKEDMEISINKAMGTEILRKIEYDPIIINNKEGLLIKGYEHKKHRIGGSLYFDTYRGIGIIGNYTGRNLFGKTSKLLFTIDLAEQPKFLMMSQKNFGFNEQWWWRTEIIGRSLKQKQSTKSKFGRDFRDNSLELYSQVNKNLKSLNGYFGLGFNYKNVEINTSLPSNFNTSSIILKNYKQESFSFNLHFKKNSLNKVFYPTNGHKIDVIITKSLRQNIEMNNFNSPSLLEGELNNFTKFQVNYQTRIPITNKLTSILESSIGLTHTYRNDKIDYFENGYSDYFFMGGALPINRENTIKNMGLYEDELFASQIATINLGMQYSPYLDFYITPSVSYSTVGFNSIENFTSNFWKANTNWNDRTNTSYLITNAITVSYNSFIGPIDLTVSKTSDIEKPRIFLSIGIPFNR
nr:patatin-like phospholipase family protein [uncultured Flavobacterium sp.]